MNTEIVSIMTSKEDIYECKRRVGEYNFRLSEIEDGPLVSVSIWYLPERELHPYQFSLSHFVYAPGQASAYVPSRTLHESEESALEHAIDAIVTFIRSAVREGHVPHKDWLIENTSYR